MDLLRQLDEELIHFKEQRVQCEDKLKLNNDNVSEKSNLHYILSQIANITMEITLLQVLRRIGYLRRRISQVRTDDKYIFQDEIDELLAKMKRVF
jgi:hypothetical protein